MRRTTEWQLRGAEDQRLGVRIVPDRPAWKRNAYLEGWEEALFKAIAKGRQ